MESAGAGVVDAWSGGKIVRVVSGSLRGASDRNHSLSWKGIPYAKAPLGDLRWMPPQPAESWAGTGNAKRFGAQCPQFKPMGGGIQGSEDCLYLNVWRPDSDYRGLPVYVWIHGGGNTMGSANGVPDYYGHALSSSQNLVFVSINYRIGPFGWFAPPVEGANQGVSPNFGTQDIIAALEWIRDNIEAFGGDPSKVTVAGESAGGANIMSLLACQRAKGLFRAAVIESGYPKIESMETARKASASLMTDLLRATEQADDQSEAQELAAQMTGERAMSFLRSIPAKRILSTFKSDRTGMTWWPTIYADGLLLPADGYACFDRGDYPVKVPLITGTNREEVKIFLWFEDRLKPESELYQSYAKYASMHWRATSVDGFASRLGAAPGQPPIWAYRFDWGSPDEEGRSELPGKWGKKLGAFHAMEVPFFLGTDTIFGNFMSFFLFTRKNAAGRRALSSLCVGYLGSFAWMGDPNVLGERENERCFSVARPRWEAWSPEAGAPVLMVLDAREGQARVAMTAERVSTASVDAEMDSTLSPDTVKLIRARMFKLE